MNLGRVKIVVFVPAERAEEVRRAIGETGAGQIGEYSFCSFSMVGVGRFLPSSKASPTIGKAGKLESIYEEKIEVICDRSKAKSVIAAIKKVHPYEEPAIDIIPLITESDL